MTPIFTESIAVKAKRDNNPEPTKVFTKSKIPTKLCKSFTPTCRMPPLPGKIKSPKVRKMSVKSSQKSTNAFQIHLKKSNFILGDIPIFI